MLKKVNTYKKRMVVLVVFLAIGLSIVVFRLYQIQIYRHDEYMTRASNQQSTEVLIMPRRGFIVVGSMRTGLT